MQRPALSSKPESDVEIILASTITVLPDCDGAVLLTGSYGGAYPASLAAAARVRAAIFHDAGVGLEGAGIAGLSLFAALGVAAAAISHTSSRIGDAEDMLERGVVSFANEPAQLVGVVPGISAHGALDVLRAAPHRPFAIPTAAEGRYVLQPVGGGRRLVLADSAALVDPVLDVDAVVVTGSHGGLIGGDPTKALRADAFAAVYNDAGIGIDDAGIGRLAALEDRGVAGITVAASSARIGDAVSTLAGIISAVNPRAASLGAEEGQRVSRLIPLWLSR